MAFGGYLLQVGSYQITGENFVNEKSYKATVSIQDLDSYRDANGVLHRNALDYAPIKVEINTRPGLNNFEWADFIGAIRSNFTVPKERKAIVTAFIPELNDYVTQEMYMPDPEVTISNIDRNVIRYESIRLAFIGY